MLTLQWMPFEEYAAQPFVQKNEFLKYINDICKTKIDGQCSGFSPASYLLLAKAPRRDGGV
ncbi:hypothetical protein ACFX13_005478 [Malus domestica]